MNDESIKKSEDSSKLRQKMDLDKLKEASLPILGLKAFEYLMYALIGTTIAIFKSGEAILDDTMWDIIISIFIVITIVGFYQMQRTRKKTIQIVQIVEERSGEKCAECQMSWQSLVASQSEVITDVNRLLTVSIDSDKTIRFQMNYYGLVIRVNKEADSVFALNAYINFPFDFIEELACEIQDKDKIREEYYNFLASEDQVREFDVWLQINGERRAEGEKTNCRKYRFMIHKIVTVFPLLRTEQLKMTKTCYMAFLQDITQIYELENSMETLKGEYQRIVEWAGKKLVPVTYKRERKKLAKEGLECLDCHHKWTDSTRLQCPHCDSKTVAPLKAEG